MNMYNWSTLLYTRKKDLHSPGTGKEGGRGHDPDQTVLSFHILSHIFYIIHFGFFFFLHLEIF